MSASQNAAAEAAEEPGPIGLPIEQQIYALKTWRYLRVAMAAIATALFAAVVEEVLRGHHDLDGKTVHCFQGSISAYYYTPVHAFLVGGLVAIGVCLFCLKGDTPVEDVLLNLAGMFAPVVALVPTDPPGGCTAAGVAFDRFANAGNNMFALVLLETIAFVTLLILVRHKPKIDDVATPPPTVADVIGFKVAAGLVVIQWILWLLSLHTDDVYKKYTHYTSAILMFVCIFLVVCFRAAAGRPGHDLWWHLRHQSLETFIATLMVGSIAVFAVLQWGVHWNKAVFQIEFCLIALFMAFWIVQTREGWHPEVGERRVGPQFVQRLSEPSS